MSSSSTSYIVSADGRELQRNDIEYGSIILVNDGNAVKAGQKISEWDGNSQVILTEKAGTVQYLDLIENVTIQDTF